MTVRIANMNISVNLRLSIILLSSILVQSSAFLVGPSFVSRHVVTSQPHQLLMSTSDNYNTQPSNMTTSIPSSEKQPSKTILSPSPFERKIQDYEKDGPVYPIHSTSEFLTLLENAPPNALVLIKFHAKFCKVCARVGMKYRKMAITMKSITTSVPVIYADVEMTANKDIISTLGIKKFPFLHIYRNKECVAAFGTGPAHNFQKVVRGTLDQKLAMTEEDWEKFRSEFQTEIASSLDQIQLLSLNAAWEKDAVTGAGSGKENATDLSP
jgi:hypothetical protein